MNSLKRFLLGQPLRTSQAGDERLTKRVALAVVASDALSSVAYATEEILLFLAVAAAYVHNSEPFYYVLPISLIIAVLLWLLLTVLLPEFVTIHRWRQFMHNQPIFLLKAALSYRAGIVVSSVSFQMR